MSKNSRTLRSNDETKICQHLLKIKQNTIRRDISTTQKLKSYISYSYDSQPHNEYLLTRQIEAVANLEKEGVKHLRKFIEREDSEFSSARKQWYDMMLIGRSFLEINFQSAYSTPYITSAIYVLDQIKKAKKIDELIDLIDEQMPLCDCDIDDLRDMVKQFDLSEKYAPELIVAVAEIINRRNYGTQGFKEKYLNEENFTNRQIVSGKQKDGKSANRKLYDDMIALIPSKMLERSLRNVKSIIWEYTDIFSELHEKFEKNIAQKLPDIDRDIDNVIERIRKREKIRNQQQAKIGKKNDVITKKDFEEIQKSIARNMQLKISAAAPLIIDDISDDNVFSNANINDVISEVKVITENANSVLIERGCQGNISGLLNKLFKSTYEDFLELKIMKDMPKDMINEFGQLDVNRMKISYPEECVFMIIYMLDNNMDEAYLFPVTTLLFDLAMCSMPWTRSKYNKCRFRQKKKQKHTPQLIDDFLNNTLYIDKKESKLSRCNMKHMLWHICGKAPQFDKNVYLNKYRYIQDYDMPDEYKTALAFAASVSTSERVSKAQQKKLEEYSFILCDDDDADVDEANINKTEANDSENKLLNKTVKTYIQKNKNLVSELKFEKSKSKQLCDENESLKKQIEALKADLEIMKTALEAEEEINNSEDEYDFPYTLTHKYAVFGGYDKLVAGMDDYFKDNIVFDTDTKTSRFEKDYVRNADVVCILIKNIGHSVYYAIVDEARRYGKELIFINCRNNELMARTIIKKDKEMDKKEAGKNQ